MPLNTVSTLGVIALAFLAGLIAATLIAGILWRRWRRSEQVAHENALEIARRESEIAARELRSKIEEEMRTERRQLEEQLNRREIQVSLSEERAKSSEATLESRKLAIAEQEASLKEQLKQVEADRAQLHTLSRQYRSRLEQLSGLSVETLRSELEEEVRRECEDEIRRLKADLLDQGEEAVREEARRILIDAMQRIAATPMHDITATIVPLPSEAMKGRIIGREGRNIKTFESATGTTLLIDETPDSVLISSFDPVRREVARVALDRLMSDGRIHPTSIEEAVAEAGKEVEQSVIGYGEESLRRARLTGFHPEIVSLLGKLRFRLSNNQNALDHSVEVANMCALMAAELKLDSEVARRAGLLHDIGKSIEGEYHGSHAVAAADLLRRHGEDARVVNAVAAHHEEVPPESAYSPLVMIADSLSAVRPGARSESLDSYLQRVSNLENLALQHPGVTGAYALQAGREIRVIVAPEHASDEDARIVARSLRRRIEEELQYPGSIKITVIREQRFTEQAK